MKKVALLLALLLFGLQGLFAQTRDITGSVTSSEDGVPIPGVSVVVKGTSIGTVTDQNGNFTLRIPVNAQTLSFSFVGMKTLDQPIGSGNVFKIVMIPASFGVEEVIVMGAYETRRTARSTAAQTQIVGSDELNVVRQTNINNALAGKVTGIQVRGQSAAKLGSSGSIRLRGDGGFGTGSGILYVVDGTILPNSNDINMDDVEDVSVLSGPAASAILGSQGSNGAIIITTKKAKMLGGKKTTVEVNAGFSANKVYILPNYQNDYAGGNVSNMYKFSWQNGMPEEWKPLDGKFYPDYSDDSSWGPRMVGQEYIPWYSWYPGTKYTGTTDKLIPHPSNARDYYNTGLTFNNTVAFSKVSDDLNVRVVIGNVNVKGMLPQTTLQKTTFTVKTSWDIFKNVTMGSNVNFFTTHTQGEFDDGYSNQTTGSFNQWFHRDLDMKKLKELKDLRTPDGIWASWNHNNPTAYDPANTKNFYAGNYWYNFYKWFDLVKIPSRADRLFGDVSLAWKILPDLTAKVTYRRQQNNTWSEQMYSTDLNDSGTQTTGNSPECKGFYYSATTYSNRENYESLLTYSKSIGDFKLNALAGTDFFAAIYKMNRAQTVNGFNIKNLYTIANSKDQPSIANDRTREKYRAVFARVDVGYKNLIFLEGTLRNDWFSVLPPTDNSIMSKSFGGSFVFSDLANLPWLEFGKIRASWGEIPTAIGVFTYPGFAYGVNTYQWNSNFLMSTPDQLVDPKIRGAVKTQKEIGLELKLFKNRVGLTATYWDGTEKDIPYAITVSQYSGFSSKYLNTGEITKKGVDFTLNLKPFDMTDFTWELNGTMALLLENKVVKIAEGINQFNAGSGRWTNADGTPRGGAPVLVHAVGKTWGQLYGGGIAKDSVTGLPLLNKNGSYVADSKKFFGNVLPRVTGGIQNIFTVKKDFFVVVNIDYQFGGKFFSLSDMWGTFSGLTAKTSGLNDRGIPIRDPVADGGGVHVFGVDATTRQPVDYYIEGVDWCQNPYNLQYQDEFVYDLTFVKLRELSIGYNLPVKKLGLSNYLHSASIAFVAQNPWLIYDKTNHDFDPSEISLVDGESGQFPGTRSFGTNLKIVF
jgi:TonB-linked SusC/RagA family outer membrane protein